MNYQKSSGFTLVELAIVLMIIGLLIGGVLRGQEMMENARIGQMIKQIQSYQAAVVTFQETYSMLPGDITNPQARVPNCTAPCSSGGNGDGLIGNYLGSQSQGNDIIVTDTSENRTAWLQLAAAHLITGINSAADFSTPTYGVQFPSTPFGEGGFHMASSTSARSLSTGANTQSNAGLILFITNTSANRISFSAASMPSYPLTAHEARMADMKIDDGLPYTGEMQTVGPRCFAQGGTGYGGGGVYDEPNTKRACAATVRIM